MIAGLANRAITVSSDEALLKDEIKRIKGVMAQNGYPRRFVEKAIRRQMKRSNMGTKRVDNEVLRVSMESSNIPFVDGLSQEIRRIVRPVGIRILHLFLHLIQRESCARSKIDSLWNTQRMQFVQSNEKHAILSMWERQCVHSMFVVRSI